ncbi:MAG: transposase [Ktedonobacterales bacterium]
MGSQATYAVDLVGPTMKHYWYQAQTGYDITHFHVDWTAQSVCCPQGHTSASWTPARDAKGRSVIKVKFSSADCKACPSRHLCTGQTRRGLTLQPRERMQALFDAREREHTAAFHDVDRHRAGIEGVHAQGTRTMGLRRSRYIGQRKTHLAHVAIAAAINVVHLTCWLRGESPHQTHISAFTRAMTRAA